MRMRQGTGDGRAAQQYGHAPSRMRISAITELSAGRDEQLGQIFRNMRLAMKVSRETIARRLATSPLTIDDFEAGAITALPHWKETSRIVRSYCELLRLDPQPILWRIRSHLDAVAGYAAASPGPARLGHPQTGASSWSPAGPQPAMRTERTVSQRARPRRRRSVRALFAISAPILFVAGVVYLAQTAPRLVYPPLALLPDQVEVPVRAGLEYLVLLTAPRRDGLRWIEVSDPQLRKADKLQTSTR
ncbi:MAG: helix-turn-helix domain-containing protein [Hyphomicrobiaceae bacterium]|nr:MAG: helix-turn-helix domain-containing protein [Hyphomicrobiaceae bacterium]